MALRATGPDREIGMKALFKKVWLPLFIVIVLATSCYFLVDYFLVKKVVTLNPSAGSKISLTKITPKGSVSIVANVDTQKKLRLRTGNYTATFSAGTDYEELINPISIKGSVTISTPELNFTATKLSGLLVNEEPDIQKLITALPISKDYSLAGESLLKQGQWYGAELYPDNWYDTSVAESSGYRSANPNNTLDIVRIIAKKENGQWKVVAGPAVIFYIGDFKDIPADVIRATNKLGL
jgi:hypothetical protein